MLLSAVVWPHVEMCVRLEVIVARGVVQCATVIAVSVWCEGESPFDVVVDGPMCHGVLTVTIIVVACS